MLKYQVLDNNRRKLLDKLGEFKNEFYLAGGTGLALQIGHRISVDFDFFTNNKFDNEKLLSRFKKIFSNNFIKIIQNEQDTITVLLDQEIKLSFFYLEYPNLHPLIETEYFYLAQIKEIGVMKLLALFRATFKDYVDIYFILKQISLKELIEDAERKHPNFDKALYLKALLSFDDVDEIPIKFIHGFETKRETIFNFIEQETIDYIKKYK